MIGASGLVGGALVRAWKSRGAEVREADLRPEAGGPGLALDMRDERAVRAALAGFAGGIVAVPAANPFVDYCESHPEETRRVNVAGTLAVARACAEAGARMVFFSSDYVFDGARGAYREEDPVCPLNEYGRQKAEAEAGVLAASPAHLVIRTANAYGWQREPKNFVLQVLRRLGAGEDMAVPAQSRMSPTLADNLAEVSAALAGRGAAGIYHVVGGDHLPRREFAALAARVFGLDESRLRCAAAGAPPAAARRPQDAVLLTDKARAAVGLPLLGARPGLERMAGMRELRRACAPFLPGPAHP